MTDTALLPPAERNFTLRALRQRAITDAQLVEASSRVLAEHGTRPDYLAQVGDRIAELWALARLVDLIMSDPELQASFKDAAWRRVADGGTQ